MIVAIICIAIQLVQFYIMWELRQDVKDKTHLFWKEDGKGNRILVNSKGEEILKI